MNYDNTVRWYLYMHFGPHLQNKRLKCSNCVDLKEGYCEGNNYDYKGVIKCMEDKKKESGIICSENLRVF